MVKHSLIIQVEILKIYYISRLCLYMFIVFVMGYARSEKMQRYVWPSVGDNRGMITQLPCPNYIDS